MTLPAPTYDLVLLLDAQAEESTRAKILADARASIQARGEIVRDDDWGERPLTYPIDRRKSAEYHLFQFHVSDNELLGGLDRTLRITDGVVRFRLIKLRPGTPAPPDMRSTAAPMRRTEGEPLAEAPPGEGAPAAAGAGEPAPAAPEAAQAEPATVPAVAPAEPPAASAEEPAREQAASEPAASEPAASEPAAGEPAASEPVAGEAETEPEAEAEAGEAPPG